MITSNSAADVSGFSAKVVFKQNGGELKRYSCLCFHGDFLYEFTIYILIVSDDKCQENVCEGCGTSL